MKERAWFQFALLFLRQFLREPVAIFWSFAFPLLTAVLIVPAFSESDRDPLLIALPENLMDAPWVSQLKNDPIVRLFPLSQQEIHSNPEVLQRNAGADVVVTQEGVFATAGMEERVARVFDAAHGRAAQKPTRVIPIPSRRFSDWLIPGVLALASLSTGLHFVTSRIVGDRQRGFLTRLHLAPVAHFSYLLGFIAAYFLLSVAQPALLSLIFYATFSFRPASGFGAFVLFASLGTLSLGLLGFLISSRLRSVQTAGGFANALYFPFMFLSGVYFKSDLFPQEMQQVIQFLPLTPLISGLRELAFAGTLHSRYAWIVLIWGGISAVAGVMMFDWGNRR